MESKGHVHAHLTSASWPYSDIRSNIICGLASATTKRQAIGTRRREHQILLREVTASRAWHCLCDTSRRRQTRAVERRTGVVHYDFRVYAEEVVQLDHAAPVRIELVYQAVEVLDLHGPSHGSHGLVHVAARDEPIAARVEKLEARLSLLHLLKVELQARTTHTCTAHGARGERQVSRRAAARRAASRAERTPASLAASCRSSSDTLACSIRKIDSSILLWRVMTWLCRGGRGGGGAQRQR